MRRPYYVTWAEKRHGKIQWYILCDVYGNNAKEVRERMMVEQNFRRLRGKPHMFHLDVTLSRPSDAALRERGHLYF